MEENDFRTQRHRPLHRDDGFVILAEMSETPSLKPGIPWVRKGLKPQSFVDITQAFAWAPRCLQDVGVYRVAFSAVGFQRYRFLTLCTCRFQIVERPEQV